MALGGLIVGVALQHPREQAAEANARSIVKTAKRDPLTGRPLAEDGLPVPPTSGYGSAQQPLRMRFVPSADAGAASVAIEGLVSFLRKRTAFAIDARILRSYGLVVEELAAGNSEVAFMTAASYARAWFATEGNEREDDDIEAILVASRQGHPDYPGSDLAYRAAILVRTDSDLQEVSQLTKGRSVAMGNRTSGAGSILPSALFNVLGLEPRVRRYEGYPMIMHALLDGAVDAACVFWSPPNESNPQNDARILIQKEVPDVFAQTRILGFTGWIPNEPVVVRKALPEEIKRTLARAITLYVAQKSLSAEGRQELEAIGSIVGYLPATNADFEPLMETIKDAFANDTEGWADFSAGRK
jgi:phosphonate transport system substrate-binding protein